MRNILFALLATLRSAFQSRRSLGDRGQLPNPARTLRYAAVTQVSAAVTKYCNELSHSDLLVISA